MIQWILRNLDVDQSAALVGEFKYNTIIHG